MSAFWMVVAAMLLTGPPTRENPWRERAAQAVAAARAELAPDRVQDALDLAYRGDQWALAARLADDFVEARGPLPAGPLLARVGRAYWRAGRLEDALAIAGRFAPDAADEVGLSLLVSAAAARGDRETALQVGARLEARTPLDAGRLQAIVLGRLAANRFDGLGPLLERAAAVVRDDGGYPDEQIGSAIRGLPEFFSAIGPGGLNVAQHFGAGPIRPAAALRLVLCDATVNGKGPLRLIVDTGGSIALSLHKDVAEELGLTSIAPAYVRGIGGLEESGQALVDELRIGEIGVTRVMTRILDLSGPLTQVADGILGTGVFAGGRMSLDFAGQRIEFAPSSDTAPAGDEIPVWIVGDMKLLTPITAAGRNVTALLDTGADLTAYSPAFLHELFQPAEIRPLAVANAIGVGDDAGVSVWTCPPVELAWGNLKVTEASGLGVDALDSQIGPIIGTQPQVLLGMPLFRRMARFTVDYPRARLWAEWNAAAPKPDEK